jgi:DNA-binding transcriptional ArsR family regulator
MFFQKLRNKEMAKIELFDQKLQETASLFKALAHPARLAILRYLAETKVCISGDISDELPLSRTTVNQHLNELKEAGLIQGDIEGVKVNYCLKSDRISNFRRIMDEFIRELNCCSDHNCK